MSSDTISDSLKSDEENVMLQSKSCIKSFVWKHFEKVNAEKAICIICKLELKTKLGSTSGLLRHLKSKHPLIDVNSVNTKKENEPTITVSYLHKDSEKSKAITNAIARMMALDLQPYSIVEDVGFRSVLKVAEPQYKIPSRSTFSRKMIPQLYEDLMKEIDNQIYSNIREGRPIVQPPSQTVTAKEGEPLSIIVEFCAEPRYSKVMWISEENVYVPGAPSKDGIQALAVEDGGTESCYRTMLSFDTIQWSHAGEWLLLVRSSEGIADASVLLNVTRASEYSHAHFRSASLACLSLCLALAILQEHRR